MGTIAAVLERMAGQRAYFDSNIFVYFLDRNPTCFVAVAALIEAVESGRILGFTGDAAVAEVMVKPYQVGDPGVIAGIKSFFGASDALAVLRHDADCFDLAAQLRAKHGMKFIDALHVATAMRADCRFFVTNDADIRPLAAIEIVSLREFVA